MEDFILVGDIGGTNTRLALCDIHTGEISNINTYLSNDYNTVECVIRCYLVNQKIIVKKACIAIACPIINDIITMTNHCWTFSIKAIKINLALDILEVINDFKAISMSIPMLKKNDVIKFGGTKVIFGGPVAIYGAGTGLGVSYLVKVNNHWISLPSEGGHVDFAPGSKEEDNILSLLRSEFGHVSVERLLSGPGLVNLYRAIVKLNGQIPENLQPKQVTAQALTYRCIYSYRALSLFCILMGRFGGNLALNMSTFGGVYIAGGIVLNFIEFFLNSAFRIAFEDKGRYKKYLLDIPVYLIHHKQPGLLGAGAYIRQLIGYKI